jgi:hypothetical protein
MYFEKQVHLYSIYPNHNFFAICVYLLMILLLHEFGFISLGYEIILIHIKYLKDTCQIMFLDLKILLTYQMSPFITKIRENIHINS